MGIPPLAEHSFARKYADLLIGLDIRSFPFVNSGYYLIENELICHFRKVEIPPFRGLLRSKMRRFAKGVRYPCFLRKK